MLDIVEGLEAAHHLPLVARRRRGGSGRPGDDVDVLFLEDPLEPVEVGGAAGTGVPVEEASDQQVGLLDAPVPGAEAQASEAGIAVHDHPRILPTRNWPALAMPAGKR